MAGKSFKVSKGVYPSGVRGGFKAMIPEIKNEMDEISQLLNEIVKVKAEDLVRSDELGKELSFFTGVPYFRRMLNLLYQLSNKDLSILPVQKLQHIKNICTQVKDVINRINSFSTTVSNPVNERDGLIANFRDNYSGYFDIIVPVIAFLNSENPDLDNIHILMQSRLDQLGEVSATAQHKTNEILSEAESTLESIRTLAAEGGVAKHSKIFQDESTHHSKSSIGWLFVTIFIGICAVVWGLNNFSTVKLSDTPKTIEIVEMFASKVAVLSAIYYVLVWSARNYNAHRHNTVLNKHRQNALDTFEAFVKAAGGDIDIKNAILLQATQTIFSNQSSGYLSKEGEQESSSKVIEIMRSVGTAAKNAQ